MYFSCVTTNNLHCILEVRSQLRELKTARCSVFKFEAVLDLEKHGERVYDAI